MTGIAAINAPVTLFPSPFPKECFVQGKSVQKAYNALYAAVSQDEDFLAQMVKELVFHCSTSCSGLTLVLRVVDGDDFIRNLWDVHMKVKAEGYTQVQRSILKPFGAPTDRTEPVFGPFPIRLYGSSG